MIRTVHVVQSAQPECTGICRIIEGLAKHSADYGYEILVLFLEDGPLKSKLSDAGISALVAPWRGTLLDPIGAIRVWSRLRRIRPSIVHIHWGGRKVRALCKASTGARIIQHIHARIDEATGAILHKINVAGSDAVIANSRVVADSIHGLKAEVIYAGIQSIQPPLPLAQYTGPLQIGVLSRLTPIKSVDSIIRAVARLRELGITAQLTIAGRGPSESALRDLASTLGVMDRVSFLGWRTDVGQLLSAWDLLVIPSRDEGFGIAALEAMARARPVLGFSVGGLPEVVLDGVTGALVPPEDQDALVRRLAEFSNDRVALAALGQEGWRRANTDFSVETMAQHTAELYDRLLNRIAS